jgi:nucleoside-diphosphate-sugar epimerase
MRKSAGKAYSGKKALVAGGAGFIGSALSKRLAELGAEVTLVDPLYKQCGGNAFNIRDLKRKAMIVFSSIESYAEKNYTRKYEYVFNCIGLADHYIGLKEPALDYRINCESGVKLALKLAKDGCKGVLVTIGSRSQYGKPSAKAVKESAEMRPLDTQSANKVILEGYQKTISALFGLDTVFLRMTNVFGPGQKLKGGGIGVIGEMIKAGLCSGEIVVYGNLKRIKDVIYVEDAVDAVLKAAASHRKGFEAFNVGGNPVKIGDFAGIISDISGAAVTVRKFPKRVKSIDTGDIVLDCEKIRKKTGWRPSTDLKDSIKLTMEYYGRTGRYYL